MLDVNLVNLVQAGGLSLILFGLYLLKDFSHFSTIIILLVFSGMSTITNFSEEVLGSRDWYLVSPIYLVGIGPLFYLCVVSLTRHNILPKHYLHLLPMLLALPFTHYPQLVIAAGSASFVFYALLIRNAIASYEQRIRSENSNSEELSMQWFLNLVVAVAIVYALDFVRLNLQPHIGFLWNSGGQFVANIAIYVALAYLIKKLLQFNEDIVQYQQEGFSSTEMKAQTQNTQLKSEAQVDHQTEAPISEEPHQYQSVFQHLETHIVEGQLFRQPRLNLAQLAKKTGLQTRDISRAINLCAQQNFNDYINQHRVEAIKTELMGNPDASLLDIGLHNGFNSKTSFNNVFKRLTGMTPGQYRSNSNH